MQTVFAVCLLQHKPVYAAAAADEYEYDDSMGYAKAIFASGSDTLPQTHSFHTPKDVDWIYYLKGYNTDLMSCSTGNTGYSVTVYEPILAGVFLTSPSPSKVTGKALDS